MTPAVDTISDEEIIRRVLDGDAEAFETLIVRYRSLVFGVARRLTPSDQWEDIAQDCFIEAFRSLSSFAGKGSFGHWLSKIAARVCYAFWRERRNRNEISLGSISEESEEWLDRVLSAESREVFEREAARNEAAEVLEYAMRGLSAEDRMVVTLVHLDGYSVAEASEILGWNTVLVKVRAHRARLKLRKAIERLSVRRKDCR